MFVGLARFHFHISYNHSLKGKRAVLKSIEARLRNRFNVAVAEIGHQDEWQLATIAVAALSTDKRHLNSTLSKIVDFVKGCHTIELLDHALEII